MNTHQISFAPSVFAVIAPCSRLQFGAVRDRTVGHGKKLKVGMIAFNWEADTSLSSWNLELFAKKNDLIRDNVEFSQFCGATPKSFGEEESLLFQILEWVKDTGCDILGFSVYIWNVRFMNRVAKAVQELMPEVIIVYGGQQVRGFYIAHLFEREQCVDICVEDEGEITFRDLLLYFLSGSPDLNAIGGLFYRDDGGRIHSTGRAKIIENLDDIPSPYLGAVDLPYGGAFLYEASRGCPYKCGYCIWAESDGVREYDMARVEKELESLLSRHPSHIMFCDGTFNMRKPRAKKIMSIMVEKLRSKEIEPFSCLLENKLELIDEEMAQIMDEFVSLNPLLTIEFGLQSANKVASELMRRPFSQERFRKAWNTLTPRVRSLAVVDCIYALPGEGIEEFKKTVDFAYSLSPHLIQCFRLSILPGSQFERQAKEFGIKYSRDPDHVVYQTKWVTMKNMEWLQAFGFAVTDLYHFHRTSVACVLGLEKTFAGFSDLITDFVNFQGSKDILGLLHGQQRPEGRWRYINLSGAFADYVTNRVIDHLGVCDSATHDRLRELLRYETLMGSAAIETLAQSTVPALDLGLVDGDAAAGQWLVANSIEMHSPFDVGAFVMEAKNKSSIDIRQMPKKDSVIAFSQHTIHSGVKFPISAKITDNMAKVLAAFRKGNQTSAVIAIMMDQGYTKVRASSLIRQLQQQKLLLTVVNKEARSAAHV